MTIATDNTCCCREASAEKTAMNELTQALHYTKENDNIILLGRIPCVVQVPFQDYLDSKLRDRSLYNIALADFGTDWLARELEGRAPDVVMGVGIEGMVGNSRLMEEGYRSLAKDRLNNPDFLSFHDPCGRFDILSGIPLVLVADQSLAEGRPLPVTFSDLLNPIYKDSIVYTDDGAILKSILMMYIEKSAGLEGVMQFRRNAICGVHPSRMIKPGGLPRKPFLMLMPWVFARLKSLQRNMKLVWFSDGAPFLPLCITGKNNEKGRLLYDILCNPAAGKVLRKNGFFPSAATEVVNALPGKLQFLGWDVIYSPDLQERIAGCRKIMEIQERSHS